MYSHDYQVESAHIGKPQGSAADTSGRQLIRYLRWAGSLLVILSAIGFMLQSHADMLPAYRYWVALAIVLALCAGGSICHYGLKERSGARLFFALGTAFLPVQVSQVSALLYAAVEGTPVQQPESSWLQFSVVHPALIAVDLVVTTFLAFAVGYTGFSMLAKRHVKTLMQTALLGNLILLLPIREGFGVPIMIALLFVRIRLTERTCRQDSAMKLAEGLTARILSGLPLAILVGRSVLYPVSFWLAIVLAALIAVFGIVDLKRYTQSTLLLYAGQALGTLAALSIWPMLVQPVAGFSGESYSLMVPLAFVMFMLSNHVVFHAKLYRSLASVFVTGLIYSALSNDEAYAPLLALATGILFVVMGGLKCREKIPFFVGQLNFMGGVLFYCGYVMEAYSSAPWLFSIGLGVVVLMLASILEKKQQLIVDAVGRYMNELKGWG